MADYILLMHDDSIADEEAWEPYLRKLKQSGCFQGGSAIGNGVCVRKSGAPASMTGQLVGVIRVSAVNLDQAKSLLPAIPYSRLAEPWKSVNCHGRIESWLAGWVSLLRLGKNSSASESRGRQFSLLVRTEPYAETFWHFGDGLRRKFYCSDGRANSCAASLP